MSFAKPGSYMREYLASLMPMLRGESVRARASRSRRTPSCPLRCPGATAPPVLVAALGPAMLKLAGTRGRRHHHLDDGHGDHRLPHRPRPSGLRPRRRAGPDPRVVVSLPVSVTADVDGAKERISEEFSIYPGLPSYKAMLDREGAADAADIALVGDEETVAASVTRLADAGATDFVASVVGDRDERGRAAALLSELVRVLSIRDRSPGSAVELGELVLVQIGLGRRTATRTPSMVRRARAASPRAGSSSGRRRLGRR